VQLTFFGVRGSCPCSGQGYHRYGGNTSCLLVEVPGDDPVIIDLGTGLRALGQHLEARLDGEPLRAVALLSHLHYDHILGLPFFGPLNHPAAVFDIYGPDGPDGRLCEVLPRIVHPPFFPLALEQFNAQIRMHSLGDDELAVGSAKVKARAIPHIGHTLGFRFEVGGVALAYLSDHQAPLDGQGVAAGVRELCDDADLLIHDAQYNEEEFARKQTWGHSTVSYAVRVAASCGVGRLLLYHHDPVHVDDEIDRLLDRARAMPEAGSLTEVVAASEGLVVELAP
jgi:ribonuclease BN (tRNA processing enzyme)